VSAWPVSVLRSPGRPSTNGAGALGRPGVILTHPGTPQKTLGFAQAYRRIKEGIAQGIVRLSKKTRFGSLIFWPILKKRQALSKLNQPPKTDYQEKYSIISSRSSSLPDIDVKMLSLKPQKLPKGHISTANRSSARAWLGKISNYSRFLKPKSFPLVR
jgi:hypothetical protein